MNYTSLIETDEIKQEKPVVTTVSLPKDLLTLAKLIGDGNVSGGLRILLTNLRSDKATMELLYSRARPIDLEEARGLRRALGLADDTTPPMKRFALPDEARVEAKGTGVLDDLWA